MNSAVVTFKCEQGDATILTRLLDYVYNSLVLCLIRPTPSPPTSTPLLASIVLYHPVYAKEEVRKVKVVHFDNQTLGDKFASLLVKVFRKGFDIVTGYKHVDLKAAMEKAEKEGRKGMSLMEMREKGLIMTPEQWLAVSIASLSSGLP